MESVSCRGGKGTGAETGPLGYDLLLIGMGTVAYILAGVIFRRRDLPAPCSKVKGLDARLRTPCRP